MAQCHCCVRGCKVGQAEALTVNGVFMLKNTPKISSQP